MTAKRVWVGAVAGLGLAGAASPVLGGDDTLLLYIGTYTGAKSQGIYTARFDAVRGTLTTPELAAATPNPTFLAVHSKGRALYAVSEVGDFAGKPEGSVSAFAVDRATGKLRLLNQAPAGGAGPCHLALDRTGRWVLVANYGTGSVAALRVKEDGGVEAPAVTIQHHGSSVNKQRQTGPHAHYITPDPRNRFALTCDLGLDKVLTYRLDAAAVKGPVLSPADPPWVSVEPGAGPRHLAFHPNGRFVCLLNELNCTLTVMAYAPGRGTLKPLQTVSTLPEGFKGNNSCAEVQVHPSGKWVYASNRGHNSIAVFAVARSNEELTCLEHVPTQGRTPRHFTLDPSGRWLLAENQDSHSIVIFALDPRTGRLQPTGRQVQVGSPVCVVFVP